MELQKSILFEGTILFESSKIRIPDFAFVTSNDKIILQKCPQLSSGTREEPTILHFAVEFDLSEIVEYIETYAKSPREDKWLVGGWCEYRGGTLVEHFRLDFHRQAMMKKKKGLTVDVSNSKLILLPKELFEPNLSSFFPEFKRPNSSLFKTFQETNLNFILISVLK
eukprot:TRINITY_DN9864_c0_g1_i1.p1 TRINITY_DN9864_c0_g1~~TRINITY_DN9864_c0_g1_i1.p1  ORF type:complete len:167 (+),score=45.68 TRINITY_DN9864_c0_g1_i1:182-682(+)